MNKGLLLALVGSASAFTEEELTAMPLYKYNNKCPTAIQGAFNQLNAAMQQMPNDTCHQTAARDIRGYLNVINENCKAQAGELICNDRALQLREQQDTLIRSDLQRCDTWQINYLESRYNQYVSSFNTCWVEPDYSGLFSTTPSDSDIQKLLRIDEQELLTKDIDLTIQMIENDWTLQ
uniref:DUF1311 domain-containing protein n=1 Tax=Strombidium rassoulzadegani TaxID=1082188 RepID=A0A7S3FVU1_9SPIT|mmetsp:Transcript_5717/g.9808  ORF Transcript_5717/g.9808 Transcript_5717/m.9808 type:complete len:178 (+) Transcript_5717:51-584(+)